jgi:hypothetical protein
LAAWTLLTSALLPALGTCLTVTVIGIFLDDPLDQARPACPFAGFSFPTASPLHSIDLFRCRNLLPACHRLRLFRPRLRTRLTLRRLTLLRNPQAFGGSGSHRPNATHSGIRTSGCSTSPYGLASLLDRTLPYHCTQRMQSMASVQCLSLLTFSVPRHSTSELLRTLSRVAASKPTSWLFLRPDFLSHSASLLRP